VALSVNGGLAQLPQPVGTVRAVMELENPTVMVPSEIDVVVVFSGCVMLILFVVPVYGAVGWANVTKSAFAGVAAVKPSTAKVAKARTNLVIRDIGFLQGFGGFDCE